MPNQAKRRKVSVADEETSPNNSKRQRGKKTENNEIDENETAISISADLVRKDVLPSDRDANNPVEASIDLTAPDAVENAENSTTIDLRKEIMLPQDDQSSTISKAPAETSNTTRTDPPSPPPQPEKHYYLHCPLTSSPLPVLIPLTPASTLSTCLNTRIILEYPTIYVLDHSPSSLPDIYLLDSEYEKREKKMIEELDEEEKVLGVVEGSVEMMKRKRREEEAEVDAGMEGRRALESLRRDVSVLSGGL